MPGSITYAEVTEGLMSNGQTPVLIGMEAFWQFLNDHWIQPGDALTIPGVDDSYLVKEGGHLSSLKTGEVKTPEELLSEGANPSGWQVTYGECWDFEKGVKKRKKK